jgi:hypothetical protein
MFVFSAATTMFAEKLDNFQQVTGLIPKAEVVYRSRVSENRILRRTFGPRKNKVRGY